MKKQSYIALFLFALFLLPQLTVAQVDFNAVPTGEPGTFSDDLQELFYDALKEKAIENYDKAIIALQKCIALEEEEGVLYFELGKNYNKIKNYTAAEEVLIKAVHLDPENEWYLDELYESYIRLQNPKKGIEVLKKLVNFRPVYKESLALLYVNTKQYKEALIVLDDLEKELGTSDKRARLRSQINNVTNYKKKQIQSLESKVEENPDTEKNYLALIFRYSESNNKEKAFETAKKLLALNPKSQLVHLALYKFYLEGGEPKKAIQSMRSVLSSEEIKPDAKLKVLTDFVNFVAKNPEYEKDLVKVASMISDSGASAKTYIGMAKYHIANGNKKKALDYYIKAENLEPENFNIQKTIILLHLDLQEFKKAEELSANGLEKYPAQPMLYLTNGVALNELTKYKDAIDVLEMGLDYIIDNTTMEIDFYKQLSKSYTGLNKLTKAKAFSDKALKLASKK